MRSSVEISHSASARKCKSTSELPRQAPAVPNDWSQSLLEMQASVTACGRDIECVMRTVLSSALQMMPNADGGVVELVDGTDMLYRAAVGTAQPYIGLRLPVAASLSGWCVRTGQNAVCTDTETDSRVDREACRRVGIRAMLIVPLPFQGRHVGVLKLHSAHANGFSEQDLLIAQLLAGPLAIGLATTAQARSEQQRLAATRRFVATFDQAAVGIAHVAPDGHFLLVNDRFCEIAGHSREALLEHGFERITHPDDLEADVAQVKELLAGRGSTYSMEKRYISGDRGTVWVNLTVSLVRDEDGQPDFFVGVVEDISARRSAEAATVAKSSFLANMSHEIRTPMNAVLGFSELLLEGNLASKERHQVELILESGRAMMRLLNDILDLSKIEAGRMSMDPEPTDLRHMLKGIIQFLRPVADHKGLCLSFEVAADVPATVLVDRFRLRQILLNLLGNALKFTGRGSVTLCVSRTTDRRGHLAFEVADTGPGIAADRLTTIFDDFVQDVSNASHRLGTGLGLSIARNLANLMEGSLTVNSQLGQGSCFIATLPLSGAEALATLCPSQKGASSVRSVRRGVRRLLLVEDHDINQEYMMDLLGSLGVKADLAINGQDALDHVLRSEEDNLPYDMVLMDVQMPVMDGLAAARAIRAHGITSDLLPIIALSANAYPDDVEACREAGMQGHLAKPLVTEVLLAVLDQYPHRSRRFSVSLREKYKAHRDRTLTLVRELVENGTYTAIDVKSAQTALHQLAGTAAIFGDGPLGAAAKDFEMGLLSWTPEIRSLHARDALQRLTATNQRNAIF